LCCKFHKSPFMSKAPHLGKYHLVRMYVHDGLTKR
jgi:hypothetical protein